MLYHCGLLDEEPANSRTLNWIKTPNWGHLPPDIEHELRVWLAMPGFTASFHAHTLGGHDTRFVTSHMGGYDRYVREVGDNWLSATPLDCRRLSSMRPGTGNVPVICQLMAVQELKQHSVHEVATAYRVLPSTIWRWRSEGFNFGRQSVPSGFELLTA